MRLKLLSLIIMSFALFAPAMALAFDPLGGACTGTAASSPACQQDAAQQARGTGPSSNPAVNTIHTAADIIAVIAGVGAIIIIIISGFMYITAGGSVARAGESANKTRQARSALIGAIVGLIIISLAWSIVTFVTDKLIQ